MDTDEDIGRKIEAEKSEGEGRDKGGWGLFRIFWASVVVVVLYVGSVGPVTQFGFAHPNVRYALNIYAPLDVLREHFDPVERFFYWYLHDVWKVPRPLID